jgi:hypothetical protein
MQNTTIPLEGMESVNLERPNLTNVQKAHITILPLKRLEDGATIIMSLSYLEAKW